MFPLEAFFTHSRMLDRAMGDEQYAEIEVIKSIYGPDASIPTDGSLAVRISPLHDENVHVCCTLHFTMPPRYPIEEPIAVAITHQDGLSDQLVRC